MMAATEESEAISTADTFERFAAHYGFSFTFCNPRSGNEKGPVENAVGAVRRNVFVPMPRVDNLRAYDKRLLDACMGRAVRRQRAGGHSLRRRAEPVGLRRRVRKGRMMDAEQLTRGQLESEFSALARTMYFSRSTIGYQDML